MNPCLSSERLRLLLDGELNGPEEQVANVHVETCPSCQALLEELTATPAVAPLGRPGAAPAPSGASRAKLSDDQLHRLRNLLPSDGSGNGAAPRRRAESAGDWPLVPGHEVLRELGRGGMAVVYEARHLRLNRKVALKMIRSGDLATPEQLVRFCAEGEILARLQHPNIVQIYEVGTHEKQPYMVLELMEGGSLAEALGGRPMRPGMAAGLVETLARAMEYAHGQGIVHRDLNPANVLLAVVSGPWSVVSPDRKRVGSPSGLNTEHQTLNTGPKISDFGLAKHLDHDSRLTRTGHVMGTPSYMAPEQVRGRPEQIGPHTDVYALGAILYEALAGRPPFQAPTSLEVMNQVAELEPVPPSRLLPGIPRDLEVVCLKCLEKDPQRRYRSAAALADDLHRFLDGVPIQARRVATVERAWRWAKRRPTVAGLLLSVILTLLTCTAVSAYFAAKASRRARDAEAAREQSELRAAELRFRAGLEQCEAGAVDRGLFTMLDAWRSSPKDAVTFRRLVRTNLAAWARQLPALEHILQHPGPGYALVRFVGADGKTLITWEHPENRQAVRWDVATGQPVGPPVQVPVGEGITDVNHQGTLLSTGKPGQALALLRDVASGRPVGAEFQHRVAGQPPAPVALFCEPGGIVVTKSSMLGNPQRHRQFWKVPTPPGPAEPVERLLTLRLEHGDTYHVTSAADGKPVVVAFRHPSAGATASPVRAEFWDLSTGKQLPDAPSFGRTDPLVSWDGKTMTSVSSPEMVGFLAGGDVAVRWWDTATGGMIGEPWRPRRLAHHAALAGDGQVLAMRGQDHRVRLFDLARGQQRGGELLTADFPDREYAPRVAINPDGSRIATSALDGVVRLWQTRHLLSQTTNAANPRTPTSELAAPVATSGTLSEDGQIGVVRVSPESGVAQLVTPAGPLAAPLRQPHLHYCAFSPDGTMIATAPNNNQFGGKGVVTIWDKAGRPLGLPLHQYRFVHTLAFSPDGRTLAVGCVGGTYLWDVPTRQVRHFLRESSTVAALRFSPDGTRLAAGHIDGWPGVGAGVRLWDVESGKPVGEFLGQKHPQRPRPFFALAFAEGGRTLRVFDLFVGKLHALDARDGTVRGECVMLGAAESAAFSADGTLLVTSRSSGGVQQWSAATGERAGSLIELPQPVRWMRYSPDGRLLAITCRDHSVHLWDTAGCAPVGPPLLHRADVFDLRFTADGRSLVTLTAAGRTHVWPLPTPVIDDPERFALWLAATCGVRLENEGVSLLEAEEWRMAKARLREQLPIADRAVQPRVEDADWHDSRACDAEVDGNVFAALWHLDRLLKHRPRDWQAHARKGSLYAAGGDFELAESAFREAAKVAPQGGLHNWHRANAAVAAAWQRWVPALRHLDWLLAAGGEDWQAQVDRAAVLGQLGRAREREEALARAVELGADAAFLAGLAEERAFGGKWPEAAALFARAAQRGGLDVMDECHHALTCLKAGDEAGYKRICERLVGDLGSARAAAFRKGGVTNRFELFRVCLLRADAVADWGPLLQLAEEVLAVPMSEVALAKESLLASLRLDWLAARGAVLCRQGRYKEAIADLQEGVGKGRRAGDVFARYCLALACLRLGRTAEAGRWVDGILPGGATGRSWGAVEVELWHPLVAGLQEEVRAAGK